MVGIDLGTATIKAVLLEVGPDGPRVARVRIAENPVDPQDKARLIRQLLAEFGARDFALAIPGRSALVRSISIPARPGLKVESTLKIEVQHRIPFPLDQVFWDSCRLQNGPQANDFLVCAIKRDIVNKFFAPYYDFPEEIAFLDVEPIVVQNLVTRLPGYNPERTCAVLDIGRESSNLVIFRKNLVLVRSLTISGASYTDSFREEKELDPAAAEHEKIMLGNGGGGDVPESIRATTSNLVTEIQSSFDYWRLTQKGEPVGIFYLAGGGSLVPGLVEAFEAKFSVPVRALDPLEAAPPGPGMAVPPHARRCLAVAVGLALRAQNPREVIYALDFLPDDYIRLQANRKNRIYVYLASFLAVVLAFTPSLFLYFESRVRETLVEHLEADLHEYEQHLPRIQDLERQISSVQGQYQSLQNTLDQRYLWLSRLIEIGRLLPGPDIVFTRFVPTPEGTAIALEGQVRGPSTSLNFRDFRQLIINLNNHPFFRDTVVNSLERRDFMLEFSLTVQVLEPDPGVPGSRRMRRRVGSDLLPPPESGD